MSGVQDQNIIKVSATSFVTPPPQTRDQWWKLQSSLMFQPVSAVRHVKLVALNGTTFVLRRKSVWGFMITLAI